MPSVGGYIYALNANTGDKLWSSNLLVIKPPAVAYGMVYFLSIDGNYYALNAATGEKVWNFTINTGDGSSPVLVDRTIIAVKASRSGERNPIHGIYCLNAENGALIWNYTIASGEPAVDNGVIYFGSDQVCALGTGNIPAVPSGSEPFPTTLVVGSVLIAVVAVAIVSVYLFRRNTKTKTEKVKSTSPSLFPEEQNLKTSTAFLRVWVKCQST
jgi:outer membrane protein assembly factor BamB